MPKLPETFYLDENVVGLAENLLGKVLCTQISGEFTSGIITETEAYNGVLDKACHAYGGKRTHRTETMYLAGGVAYIYLCYGIHHLFNVVTGSKDDPKAVLIRSIEPLDGKAFIVNRRKGAKNLGRGPGVMSQALGLTIKYNAESLLENQIWIEDRGVKPLKSAIEIGPRIGIDYAEEDADLPYRFNWLRT